MSDGLDSDGKKMRDEGGGVVDRAENSKSDLVDILHPLPVFISPLIV